MVKATIFYEFYSLSSVYSVKSNTGLLIPMLQYQLEQSIPGVDIKEKTKPQHHPAFNEETHSIVMQPQAYQQQIQITAALETVLGFHHCTRPTSDLSSYGLIF